MPYTPQYGGTNGVPELDIGQAGSSRRGASQAYSSVIVIGGTDRSTTVEQAIVQQNLVFRDELGFRPGQRAWEGLIRTSNVAVMTAILSDINRYLHGSARVNGRLAAPDKTYLLPTRLTDAFGTIIAEEARLADWSLTSAVKKLHAGTGGMNYMAGFRIVFLVLG